MKNGFSVFEQENQSKFFLSKLLHCLWFWHNFSLTTYCSTIIKATCMTCMFSGVPWQCQVEWVWSLKEVVLKKALELLTAVTEYQLHLGALVIALTSGVSIVASERTSEISVSYSSVIFVQILHWIFLMAFSEGLEV